MKKIPAAVLGATGSVGQKFIELLSDHPWFEVKEVAASDRSAGKKYKDAVNWFLASAIPESVANLEVKNCTPELNSRVVFSGLDAGIAGEVESAFAKAGYIVITNSRNHRMDEDVPLLVPEVNPDHLGLIKYQDYNGGCIVTNPNCSVIGLALALKPLIDSYGLESVNIVTMQALSGAGYPGVSSLDIIDNVIPFISGEEEKMEKEPLKIFGEMNGKRIVNKALRISAQCNRVAVSDGHMECVQVNLGRKASTEDIISKWNSFKGEPQSLKLPSAPLNPLYYFENERYPQPKLHRNIDKGMAVAIGRLREDPLFQYKFVILSHNTNRGAAGGAILCAELMKAKGLF